MWAGLVVWRWRWVWGRWCGPLRCGPIAAMLPVVMPVAPRRLVVTLRGRRRGCRRGCGSVGVGVVRRGGTWMPVPVLVRGGVVWLLMV